MQNNKHADVLVQLIEDAQKGNITAFEKSHIPSIIRIRYCFQVLMR